MENWKQANYRYRLIPFVATVSIRYGLGMPFLSCLQIGSSVWWRHVTSRGQWPFEIENRSSQHTAARNRTQQQLPTGSTAAVTQVVFHQEGTDLHQVEHGGSEQIRSKLWVDVTSSHIQSMYIYI